MRRPARCALLALLPMALLPLPLRLIARAFPGQELLFSLLEELLLFGLPALLLWPRKARRARKLPPLLPAAGFLAGGLMQALLIPLTALLQKLLPGSPAHPALPDSLAGWVLAVAAWVLVPALCEECFFRGVLCRSLADAAGARRAVIVSAGAFALLHGQLTATPALFLLALLLGSLLLTTDSLPLCIAVHAGFNLAALLWRKPVFFHALPLLAAGSILFFLLWRKHGRRPARPAQEEDPLLPLLIPAGLLAACLSFFL